MNRTLVVLNPHAAGGQAGKLWPHIEPLLWEQLGNLDVAITQHADEVLIRLHEAQQAGVERVISIGGDGTNHALINALAVTPQHQAITYGILPIGTGRDWARSQNIPFDLKASINWLGRAKPQPIDIGLVDIDGAKTHFLNIASVGLGGMVDERVNNIRKRRPWTFLKSTIEAILTYQPQYVSINLDDKPWFEDRALLVAIANGSTFGHGMKIAPDAKVDDGLFDIILIEALSPLRVLIALQQVYKGTHLQNEGVHFERARQVEITSRDGLLKIDLDGEFATGERLLFTVQPQFISMLS